MESSTRTQPHSVRYPVSEDMELAGGAWGSPEDPPVVLLHGGGQTRHAWQGTAAELARQGWYAVAVDQRGHGESRWSESGEYTLDSFAADARALAQSFRRPPVLVGASLGGIASLIAATEAPEAPVAALILVDIATRMEMGGASRIMNFMRAKPDGFVSLEEAADAVAAYLPHRKKPRDLGGLAKNLRKGDDGRYRWHWDPRFVEGKRGLSKETDPHRLDRAAQKLSIPTLLIRGRMSDLLSEAGAQAFLELAPHARFSDVSDAGHMVAGDRNDAFTHSVIDFLRELRTEV